MIAAAGDRGEDSCLGHEVSTCHLIGRQILQARGQNGFAHTGSALLERGQVSHCERASEI